MGSVVFRRARRRSGGAERRGRRYTLALIVLTSLTLAVLDVRGFAPLDALRGLSRSLFAPVGDAAAGVTRPLGDAWTGVFAGADLARENEELRRQVEDLQGRVAERTTAETELGRLQAALDLPAAGALERVTARVTSGVVADFDLTVEIDRGAEAGIAKGMPVVVGAGLVGSVVQVSGGRAVVRLAADRGTRVGVTVAGGPNVGLVEGRGDRATVRAGGFDVAADLPVGALLVTAGTPGSLYPPGIPVGTVTEVEVDGGSRQKVAEVRLAARLDDLMYVTVLLHRSP